jgi:hypothetical protein
VEKIQVSLKFWFLLFSFRLKFSMCFSDFQFLLHDLPISVSLFCFRSIRRMKTIEPILMQFSLLFIFLSSEYSYLQPALKISVHPRCERYNISPIENTMKDCSAYVFIFRF